MNTYILINWPLFLSGFMCLAGIAVILAFLSLKIFSITLKEDKNLKINLPGRRTWMFSALGLILVGTGIYFIKRPTPQLVVMRINDLETRNALECPDDIYFKPEQLVIDRFNRQYQRGDAMVFLRNGFFSLPYLNLSEGTYVLEFQARGTAAENVFLREKEYARIKVEIQRITSRGYAELLKVRYIALGLHFAVTAVKIELDEPKMIHIRISFINDATVLNQGRKAWMKEIHLTKVNTP